MKPKTPHDKPAATKPEHENIQHEQEDAASRDYKLQRDGGIKKKADEKPKQTPP